jgi:mono/diheme cytochrome c family protein
MSLRRWFAITSVLLLVVLAISPVKSALRPYRPLQRQFARLGAARAKGQQAVQTYLDRPVAIQQIWLRNFDNRVDRCTTCHLGVQDANFAAAPAPFRLHPHSAHTPKDFDRFGCTSCHGGQGLATLQDEAHGLTPEAGGPMLPVAYLEAGCGKCHAEPKLAGADQLSRGRLLLEQSGCYACHAVKGHEGFRSEAPPLEGLADKTGREALRRWLQDPHAVDPNASMPNFQLADADVEALSHFLFSQTSPRDLSERVQAAGREAGGDPVNGKNIFAEARCISCHSLDGKGNGSAPELSKVASRATPGWMLAFLRDPHAFNPRTRMPRFGFNEQESRDVVAYMTTEFKDFDAPKEMLDPLRVNQSLAEKGKKLFRTAGCFACHAPQGGESDKFGPELNGIGEKRATSLEFGPRKDLAHTLPDWLSAKIQNPRSMGAGLKMPSFGFSPQDSQAVVTALLALTARPVPEAYRAVMTTRVAPIPGGSTGALMDKYRCLSCHQIGTQGGDISKAPLTSEGSKVKQEWLVDYLVLSTTIRPILTDRMPVFRMSRAQATQLAQAMGAFFLDPSIPEDPFAGQPPSAKDPAEGQRVYDALGCRTCHILGQGGGYYGPPLTEAGKRLKSGWVFKWLKGPQAWRADVRCPNYGLSDLDALRITAYLETQVGAPAKGGRKGGAR